MTEFMQVMRSGIAAIFLVTSGQIAADFCFSNDPSCELNEGMQSCTTGIFVVQGEALYLRAEEGGLSRYGPKEIIDDCETSILELKVVRHCKNPHFDWNWGYRVAAGLKFPCNSWEMGVALLHFQQGSNLKFNENDRHDLLTDASSWKIKLNYVDFLVGYRTEMSTFRLKFFGGIRGAAVDQDFRAHAVSHFIDCTEGAMNLEYFFTRHSSKQKLKGIGPLFGLEGNLDLGYGLNLFLNGDVGCLYARFHSSNRTSDILQTETFVHESKTHHRGCQFFIDAALGLRWKILLCNNEKLFLQIGVEQHTLFDHNRIGSNGNLNLYGGSFGAGLEF